MWHCRRIDTTSLQKPLLLRMVMIAFICCCFGCCHGASDVGTSHRSFTIVPTTFVTQRPCIAVRGGDGVEEEKKESDKESGGEIRSEEGGGDTLSSEEEEEDSKMQDDGGGNSKEDNKEATNLRLQGKDLHDQGDFEKAAQLFEQAADILEGNDQETSATCRLHQALCHLKSSDYERCWKACDSVIESTFEGIPVPIRARAYHRRAKAKLGLKDSNGALQDARSAAFLGDSKAVGLYGKILRESSGTSSSLTSLFDGYSNQNDNEKDKLMPPSSPNAALLESLMNKSSSNTGLGRAFSPASLLTGNNNFLGSILGTSAGKSDGKNAAGSMAQSVLSSITDKLEDEPTQTMICSFVNSATKEQLKGVAEAAGVGDSIDDGLYDRVLTVCHNLTPKKIRSTVGWTKRGVYVVRVTRKIGRVVRKYKSLLVGLVILQWTKSACFRPLPKASVSSKTHTNNKRVLNQAMKASR